MRGRKSVGIVFAVIVALGWGRAALASPEFVALGSDYFQTQPGTSFNFGGPIGTVNFLGNPIGPGNTDTIVQRQADAVIGGGSIPIQLTALSLKSAAPVNLGGSFFDVFVTLNPDIRSTGTMNINGSLAGGTFTSMLDVSFDAHFQPVIPGTGNPFDVFDSATLTNGGADWGPTPGPGALLVPGADFDPSTFVSDPFAVDQAANLHSGLASDEVDFFLIGSLTEDSSGAAHHVVDPAGVPEPGSLLLLGSGLAGFLGAVTWRRYR